MKSKHIFESIHLAIFLTGLSYIVGLQAGWVTELNWLEIFAVFTSYSCTWLCTRQSRWNYPIGVVTTAAYSVLFWQWGALALAVFNLYLVFSLVYGWFYWRADENTRPVTNVEPVWYLGYGAIGVAVLMLFLGANALFNPTGIAELSRIDVGLAVFSGIAQMMLDRKKLQNWIVWAGINIVSIPYFIQIGLPLVAFQYVFFLINTGIGYYQWRKSMV